MLFLLSRSCRTQTYQNPSEIKIFKFLTFLTPFYGKGQRSRSKVLKYFFFLCHVGYTCTNFKSILAILFFDLFDPQMVNQRSDLKTESIFGIRGTHTLYSQKPMVKFTLFKTCPTWVPHFSKLGHPPEKPGIYVKMEYYGMPYPNFGEKNNQDTIYFHKNVKICDLTLISRSKAN